MQPTFTRSTFDALTGKWELTKRVSPDGHFRGKARFERKTQNQLLFTEIGTLYLPQGNFENSGNQYLYQLKTNTIEIHFHGFRTGLFQALRPTEGATFVGEHLCGNDLYISTYEFLGTDRFHLTHEVQGPKKAYCIEAEFRRTT